MKTEMKVMLACAVLVVTGLFTTIGHAQGDRWQVLRDDPTLRDGLTVFAIGRRIDRRCDEIDARRLQAFGFLRGLVHHAESLGFTRDEIEAYVEDEDEQERYKQIARAYFAERGVDWRDNDGICRVGRDEISSGSPIGRLLRGG
ncbi:hypothetical protein roselon_00181 [Roseibacterium elongatum DSM 19469]|uniref:DUF5333 domain-containing protein n=1 Tax=Roseicyclus elongatus DSM 19469 TaxID=1294273 RepID=W8RNQ7_9RHOB|nr:DUF5333 domain-containing protein [Roseibacterium elongatum]AHM02638.1 hypothetical protein roselon_00181 [Roseibacterium elongatum DSM 19469]